MKTEHNLPLDKLAIDINTTSTSSIMHDECDDQNMTKRNNIST